MLKEHEAGAKTAIWRHMALSEVMLDYWKARWSVVYVLSNGQTVMRENQYDIADKGNGVGWTGWRDGKQMRASIEHYNGRLIYAEAVYRDGDKLLGSNFTRLRAGARYEPDMRQRQHIRRRSSQRRHMRRRRCLPRALHSRRLADRAHRVSRLRSTTFPARPTSNMSTSRWETAASSIT